MKGPFGALLHWLVQLRDHARPRLAIGQGFISFVTGRFVNDRCLQSAAALAYTALLSIVPLMAVTFSTLAAFPVFQSFSQEIQDFVFLNFVPTSGEVVQEYLQSFTEKASRLTVVGIAGVMLTALMMMATIDKSLNRIWRSRKKRGLLSAFTMYWAMLTLGPVLVGLGLFVSSYLVSLPMLTDASSSTGVDVRGGLLRWMPFLSSTLAFTLLYILVPNRSVPFRPALVGGLVAAFLFENAKRAFAWYVTNFPTYEAIYGALASIPIFLMWIYVSWVIVLFGAEISHSLYVYRHAERTTGRARTLRPLDVAFRIMTHLYEAQQRGQGRSEKWFLERERDLGEERLLSVLDKLAEARLVHRTDVGSWALARDISELQLLDLYRAVPVPLACREAGEGSELGSSVLESTLRGLDDNMAEGLQRPLKSMLHEEAQRRLPGTVSSIAIPKSEPS